MVMAVSSKISASLLEGIQFPPSPSTKRRIKENFNLGMDNWLNSDDDSDDFQPLKKYCKQNITNGAEETTVCTRFPEPTSKEELAKMQKE